MGIFEYSMIFILCWWLAFFLTLPFGVRQQEAVDGAAYPAAPQKSYLKRKLIAATILAFVLTFMVSWIIQSGILDI